MSVGSKLKEYEEKHFESVADFARALNMHRESLYKYYKDESMPGGEFLIKLKALGCDLNWLFSDGPATIKEGIVIYGGVKDTDLQRLHELQKENAHLKRVLTKINDQLSAELKALDSPSPGNPIKVKS